MAVRRWLLGQCREYGWGRGRSRQVRRIGSTDSLAENLLQKGEYSRTMSPVQMPRQAIRLFG